MGVAAFLMSGVTGIPYGKVVGVAAFPALLYIFSCALYVDFQARKLKINPPEIPVDYKELILRAPLFLISLLVITILFMKGYSALYVSFWACITIAFLSLIRKTTRPSFNDFADGVLRGAKWGAAIGVTCATLGLLVAALTNTGLGVKLPAALGRLAGDHTLLLLVLTGFASLALGTGMPASAAYILVAMVLAPLLVAKGIPLLAAHLFCFYLANFSYLTPPVAISSLFASRLAGSGFMRTAFESVKVGIGGFILPFMIVWVGALTWNFANPLFEVTAILGCILAFVGIQACLVGYFLSELHFLERLIVGASPFCLLTYMAVKDIAWFVGGIIILTAVFLWQYRKKRLRIRVRSAQDKCLES